MIEVIQHFHVVTDPKAAVRAAKMLLRTGVLKQFEQINAQTLGTSP
jgi:hypothetical protein